ncbi:NAD(P)/FAD-dependent oxidoreductase [Actinocrispum wychmicini]|uniref:Ferredoxin--NADP reductase n=1 Tax=Actinocrispum wychmicini TaxID=1213861 RepID=A0A4R2JM30_9PSEU|nr:NAD(P)/FAD-dependent oxidoreductase [Actinocrispum wychmicini]TCO61121.1 thioredoxin reductase (NADPH) [Actinocrispum wychmicini]
MSETPAEVDVLIVGAGPVGLYGAYYAGFRGLRTAVIDVLPQLGGQVIAMYPEKPIFDIAGFPQVTGRVLIENLVAQAAPFEPVYLLGRQAVTLGYDDGLPTVTTADGSTIGAKAVILTAGLGTFTPRPLPAATGYEGRGLAYFVQRLDDYADKDVVIVGGGDSAFDWAATLEPIARSVTLVHRRDRFRAHRGTVAAVQRGTVRMLVNSEVTEVRGADAVETMTVRNTSDGVTQDVKAQAIIAALGFTTHLGPLAKWGLDLRTRHIVVDTRMATNLPRVYAAGDIAEYPGKVRLIAVGFGEVALAVNNAATVIDPDAQLFPGHSTDAAA